MLERSFKSIGLLFAALLAALAMCTVMLVATPGTAHADGEYTVHYETWDLLGSYDEIPDKTGVSWDQGNLGAAGAAEVFRYDGFTFEGWCTDENLEHRYSNQTYAQLAGDDPSVTTVTLYAQVGFNDDNDDSIYYHPWSKADSLPSQPGDFFLLRNVTLVNDDREAGAAWTAPQGTTRINLHGHTISRQEASDDQGAIKGSVIRVPAGADLKMEDPWGDGRITGGDAGDGEGGGVLVEGTFSMPQGSIVGNTAAYGGGVAVAGSGTANLRRAVISGNTATEAGGGIAVLDNGSLSFTGTITGNSVPSGKPGGGIYLEPGFASLSLWYANSSWYADQRNWSKDVNINGNKAGDEPSNIWLSTETAQRIRVESLDWDSNSKVGITLSSYPDAYTDDEQVFTSSLGSKRHGVFFLDDSKDGAYEIRKNSAGNEACVAYTKCKVTYKVGSNVYREDYVYRGRTATKPADPVREGDVFVKWLTAGGNQDYDFDTAVTGNITLVALFQGDHFHDGHFWQAWSSRTAPPMDSGYYYLANDIHLERIWNVNNGTEVHICLNGHSIQGGSTNGVVKVLSSSAGSVCKLDLYDCTEGSTGSEPGFIKGDPDASNTVSVGNGGTFTLHGGTIKGLDNARGSAVIASGYSGGAATFNMLGGTITGNHTSQDGGAVHVAWGAKFKMSGGTITGNSTTGKGGGIFIDDDAASFTLDPSGEIITISGNTSNGEANGVFLQNNGDDYVKISVDSALSSDTVIGVETGKKPTEEADVVLTGGLSGNGTIANFSSEDEAYTIEDVGGEAVLRFNPLYKEYPISYELAGGALPEGASNPDTYMPANDAITLVNPVRDHYEFTGWTGTGLDEPTMEVTIPSGSSGERSYTATWRPVEYSIAYLLNGGKLPEGQSNPYTYTIESNDITLVNPVLEGSEFRGWYLVSSDELETTEMVIPAGSWGDKTFIALWGGIDHRHTLVKVDAVDPTCEGTGHIAYWVCGGGARPCGKAFADAEGTVELDLTKTVDEGGALVPALGHDWGNQAGGFIDNYTRHHAYRTCKRDSTHKEEEFVEVTSQVTPPTCTKEGFTTYTAGTYTNPAFSYYSGRSMSLHYVPVDPNAHSWGDWTVTTPATCMDPGTEQRVCVNNSGHKQTRATAIDPDAHAWGDWTATTPATCTETGVETRTCTHNAEHFETRDVAALGHDWSAWKTDSKTATKIVESRTCSRGDVKQTRTTTVKQNTVWKRIWGKTAPITMQAIAKEFGKTNYAIVTTDSSYKDALAASALAGKCNGLVLMTNKSSLTPQTKAALKNAGVKTVYIVGSTANVSANVEKQLKSGTGVTKVIRVAGTTPSQRAVTAAKVGGKKSDTVIIATQNGFQDALSIAPYSYATKSPILYAETNKKLSAATTSFIKSAGYKKAIIVGGPIALPASIDSQLKSAGVTSVTRLAGTNLYATSQQIADWTTGSLKNGNYGTYQGKTLAYVKFQPSVKLGANKLAVSTGQNWLDALAGAAMCGKNRSVILLADTKTAKSNYKLAADWCSSHKASIKNGYVFGGTSAVSQTVWNALVESTKTKTVGEPVEVTIQPTYTTGG